MIQFRMAVEADLEAIRQIYNEAIANTTAVYEYEPFTTAYMQQWFSEKRSHNFPVIVAVSGENVAGFATYGIFRSRAAYFRTMEHSVYVHPGFRRQGIGRALLRQIEQTASANKVHVLVGGIDAENELSINLHLDEGFKIAGKIHQAAWKFDRWLDLVFVEKMLLP
jgi:L-amino acid N-acyltransferase YncA